MSSTEETFVAESTTKARFEFPLLLHAIPFLLAAVAIEFIISHLTNKNYYRFNDTINNLSLGLTSRLLGIYIKFLAILPFKYIHEHYRLVDFQLDHWYESVIAFFGVDIGYYCAHRFAHGCNFVWGGHKTHHQSEEFNLSVALRQGAAESMFSWVFYLPLALFFDYNVFLFWAEVNLLWQFWVHTKHIKKMPNWFEFIFVTPSHHRVHHASNPAYIDCNFGGLFIIWDRLFGTYAEEKEPCVYGLTIPLKSWDPLVATFGHFHSLYVRFRKFPKEPLINKLQVMFYGPGYSPKTKKYLPVPYVDEATFVKYDPFLPNLFRVYIGIQFFLAHSLGVIYILDESSIGLKLAWIPVAFVLFWLVCVGRLMEFCVAGPERARLAFLLETIRLTSLIVFSAFLLSVLAIPTGREYFDLSWLMLILTPHLVNSVLSPLSLASILIFNVFSLIFLKLWLEPLIQIYGNKDNNNEGNANANTSKKTK